MDMATRIRVAVAWADIIICDILRVLPYILIPAAVGTLVGLAIVGKQRGRW